MSSLSLWALLSCDRKDSPQIRARLVRKPLVSPTRSTRPISGQESLWRSSARSNQYSDPLLPVFTPPIDFIQETATCFLLGLLETSTSVQRTFRLLPPPIGIQLRLLRRAVSLHAFHACFPAPSMIDLIQLAYSSITVDTRSSTAARSQPPLKMTACLLSDATFIQLLSNVALYGPLESTAAAARGHALSAICFPSPSPSALLRCALFPSTLQKPADLAYTRVISPVPLSSQVPLETTS